MKFRLAHQNTLQTEPAFIKREDTVFRKCYHLHKHFGVEVFSVVLVGTKFHVFCTSDEVFGHLRNQLLPIQLSKDASDFRTERQVKEERRRPRLELSTKLPRSNHQLASVYAAYNQMGHNMGYSAHQPATSCYGVDAPPTYGQAVKFDEGLCPIEPNPSKQCQIGFYDGLIPVETEIDARAHTAAATYPTQLDNLSKLSESIESIKSSMDVVDSINPKSRSMSSNEAEIGTDTDTDSLFNEIVDLSNDGDGFMDFDFNVQA